MNSKIIVSKEEMYGQYPEIQELFHRYDALEKRLNKIPSQHEKCYGDKKPSCKGALQRALDEAIKYKQIQH